MRLSTLLLNSLNFYWLNCLQFNLLYRYGSSILYRDLTHFIYILFKDVYKIGTRKQARTKSIKPELKCQSRVKGPYENYFWKIRTTVTSVNHSRQFRFLLWLTHTWDRFEDSSRVYIHEIFLYLFTHVEIARDFTTTFQVMSIIASWNRRNSERGQIKRNILFETNLRSASVYTKRTVFATSSVSEIFAFFRISCVTLDAKKIEAEGSLLADRRNCL